MNKKKLGEEYHKLTSLARRLKDEQNKTKIELGIVLLDLSHFLDYCEIEGIDDFGTFKQNLASLHLSYRRVFQMIRNARYVLDEGIPVEQWHEWDSAILELLRKNNKKTSHYIHDVRAGLSYIDLTKKL